MFPPQGDRWARAPGSGCGDAVSWSFSHSSVKSARPSPASFSSTAKFPQFPHGEKVAERRADISQFTPGSAKGPSPAPVHPPAVRTGAVGAIRSAPGPSTTISQVPAATARAYANDSSRPRDVLRPARTRASPGPPTDRRLYLKALEGRRSRTPAALKAAATGGSAAPVGLALSTLRRRLAAIASRHTTKGLETPTDHPLVSRMLRRYARSRGTAKKKKDALLIERFPAILMAMPQDLAAARDRALLLLGYAGAFRRSEVVALDVEDLRFSGAGLYVWIAAAKNDPRKVGRELYVPRLPASGPKRVSAPSRRSSGGWRRSGPPDRSFAASTCAGSSPRIDWGIRTSLAFSGGDARPRASAATSPATPFGVGSSRTPRRRRSPSRASSG